MNTNAMFKLSYGLFVLTTKLQGKDNGCIVNTVPQIADKPLRIAVAVNKANYTHDMLKQSGIFNASILSEKATFDIFKRFGFASGRDTDKFKGFEDKTARSENGLIYITEGTNAYISGKVVDSVDLGSHTMFIAEVTDCELLSQDNSATYDFYHINIKPKPQATEKKGYRCKICGYVYEGESLPDDFVCPICKHPASDFEKI